MFARDADIPLDRDPSSRFLPWLIGLMVYLAALALAGTLTVDDAVARWDRALSSTLTVQVPPAAREADRIEAVLRVLRDTPGVERAEPIASERLDDLLRPWLGPGGPPSGLPMPALIDVTLERRNRIDLEALGARLAADVPGTVVNTHDLWVGRLVDLFRSLELIAGLIVVLVGAATVTTVVFSARAGLTAHREAIELLHLIGAEDRYVARQFARQARDLGLVGGLGGLALAIATILFIGWMARGLGGGLLPALSLGLWHWAGLLALPAVAAAVTMATAWVTVLRTLGRMV